MAIRNASRSGAHLHYGTKGPALDFGRRSVDTCTTAARRNTSSTCRNEWADLKSVASTGGMSASEAGRSPPDESELMADEASAPEVYPIEFGVVRMGSSPRGGTSISLKALARAR